MNDSVELLLLRGCQDRSHFEYMEDCRLLKFTHGHVKSSDATLDAIRVGAVLRNSVRNLSRRGAHVGLESESALRIGHFNRMNSNLLVRAQVDLAMHDDVQRTALWCGRSKQGKTMP